MFTQNQIEIILVTMRKALMELKNAGVDQTPQGRLEQRILATLERAEQYTAKHPELADVLAGRAMPKTVLRRALGGNAAAIDDALTALVGKRKILYFAAWMGVKGRALRVYQLVEKQQ